MPVPAGGEKAFVHALNRRACLQVLYAQAERQSSSAQKSASPSKSNKQVRPPLPSSAVYVVEKVSDALGDVVAAFIQQVGRSAKARANLAGRNKSTFLDVVSTLNAMSSATQATVRDIARYAMYQQIAFPTPVPSFPILPSALPSKMRPELTIEVPSDDPQARRLRPFIEQWMPSIPNAHTFISNPGILAPPNRDAQVKGPEQRRLVEMSLERLRDASVQQDPASQSDPLPSADLGTSIGPYNPFTCVPKVVTSAAAATCPSPIPTPDDSLRGPLEDDDDNVDSNADVDEVTKFSISDQKRARVDRILAESGTIMLGGTSAGAQADQAGTTPSTPKIQSAVPTPSLKGPGGV